MTRPTLFGLFDTHVAAALAYGLFNRSPAGVRWSPTDTDVTGYPELAQLWWQNEGDVSSGVKTAQEAMDALCEAREKVLSPLERAGVQGDIGAMLNDEEDPQYWFDRPGAPKAKPDNEKPELETIDYDERVTSRQ